MLRLPAFEYLAPHSLEEAVAMLAAGGPSTRVVAGGTDLWPNMKRRHQSADRVVSLMAVPEIRGISANGEIRLGATARLSEVAGDPAVVARLPALARAVRSISSPPLRTLGTIGGNVCVDTRCTYYNQTEEWRRAIGYCLKASGTTCWVATSSKRCLAHTASDSAPMLSALGARARLVSTAGERTVDLPELFRDDGMSYLTKRPNEILTELVVPATADASRCRSAFWKLRRRGSIDFAVLSVAVALWLDGEAIERAEVYLGAVSSRPRRADGTIGHLIGHVPTEERLAEAADLARKAGTPFDNTDFAPQWRKQMIPLYVEAALRDALGWPVRRLPPAHH